MEDEYLGDGVYAVYEESSGTILLDLRGQDNTTVIALEPHVLESLDRYRQRIKREVSNG